MSRERVLYLLQVVGYLVSYWFGWAMRTHACRLFVIDVTCNSTILFNVASVLVLYLLPGKMVSR